MARQAGPPYFIGRMGNFIGFKRNGNYYMKAAPEEVDNKRSNNTEMGAGSSIGKVFRESIPSLIEQFNHSNLNSRLAGIFNKILQQTKKSTGERKLDLKNNKGLIVGFEFSKNNSFDQKCNGTWLWRMNDERDRITLQMVDVNASIRKKKISETHYRIIAAATVLSDYMFDVKVNRYKPKNEGLNGKSFVSYSNYMDITKGIDQDQLILNFNESIPNDCSIIMVLGIEFFKEEGVEKHSYITHQALKIVEVF